MAEQVFNHSSATTSAATSAAPSAALSRTSRRWLWLWRADAIFNLLFGDVLVFAAGPLTAALGMPSGTVLPLQVIGAFFWAYGLWELWRARRGEVARRDYWIALGVMDASGTLAIGAVLAGMDFNTAGIVTALALGASAYILALAWFVRARQVA